MRLCEFFDEVIEAVWCAFVLCVLVVLAVSWSCVEMLRGGR